MAAVVFLFLSDTRTGFFTRSEGLLATGGFIDKLATLIGAFTSVRVGFQRPGRCAHCERRLSSNADRADCTREHS